MSGPKKMRRNLAPNLNKCKIIFRTCSGGGSTYPLFAACHNFSSLYATFRHYRYFPHAIAQAEKSRVRHGFFSKEPNVLAFFCILYKRTRRSFAFFIKERGILCVVSFFIKERGVLCVLLQSL